MEEMSPTSRNWKELELNHLKDLWDVRPPGIVRHTKDFWDEKAHRFEKDLTEDESREARSRRRVEETAAYLIERGVLTEESTVIDIGCGPGRFVAEFAETAKQSDGLDISGQMTEYGLEYCNKKGVKNVSFYARDFKHMDVKKEGFFEKYDLVFSSITPAIGYKGGYEKAFDLTKEWFFNANYISVTDTLQTLLEKELGRFAVRSRDGAGFYCMLSEMILKGLYPELRYFRETDVDLYDPDAAYKEYSRWFYREGPTKEQERRMKEVLLRLCGEDGKLRSEKEWVYAWLLVSKNGRIVH